MAGLPVVAGPCDGATCKAIGGKFVFLTPGHESKPPQPSRTPTPGSHVYIRESTRYRYAGHGHRVCGSCGAHLKPHEQISKALDACALCGHPLGSEPR